MSRLSHHHDDSPPKTFLIEGMVATLLFPIAWFGFAQLGKNVAEPSLPYWVFLQALSFTACTFVGLRWFIRRRNPRVGAVFLSLVAFGFFSFMSWLVRIWTG